MKPLRSGSLLVCFAVLFCFCTACGSRSPLDSGDESAGSGSSSNEGSGGATAESCHDIGAVKLASSPGAGAVAADDSGVYWAVEDGIWSIPAGATKPKALASGGPMPFAIAVDDAYVYWTATIDGGSVSHLSRVPKRGGAIERLWKGSFELAQGVAVDATDVYWIGHYGWSVDDDRCEILAMPKAGGEPRTVIQNQSGPASLAIDDDRVFWLNEGKMDDYGAQDVRSAAKTGGDVVTLAHHQGSWIDGEQWPNKVVTDGASVYWVLNEGTVRAVAVGGGPVRTIAFGQEIPRALAVTDGDLYWSDAPDDGSPGALMRDEASGMKRLVDQVEQPWNVATHGPFVYWTNFMAKGQVGSVFRTCR